MKLEPDLARIAFLARETLPEWWRRFAHERNIMLTDDDMAYLLAEDAAIFPHAARQDAERDGRWV